MSSQLQIDYILLLVKDSNSKCGKWKMSLEVVWGGFRVLPLNMVVLVTSFVNL